MRRKHPKLVLGIGIGLLLLGVAWPASAAEEAKMYVVTTWNGGCAGDNRGDWDNMVNAWYNAISGHAEFFKDGSQVNGDIVNSQYADSSVVAWGNDTSHLDDGDAVMIGWHGGEDGNVYRGSMRVDEAGAGDCHARRDEMQLGDADLEFFHLSSCHSLDDNQWGSWYLAFSRLHQVNGFHGVMWISWLYNGNYSGFANDAFSVSISSSWLDHHYKRDGIFTNEQCPVSYAVGTSGTDCSNRINNERYNNIYGDPTGFTNYCYQYLSPCDPDGEGPI